MPAIEGHFDLTLKKMMNKPVTYMLILGVLSAAILGVLCFGKDLYPNFAGIKTSGGQSNTLPVLESGKLKSLPDITRNLNTPTGRLILQVLVILLACCVMRVICARIGQPPVVGEMFAGIVIGPSLLGLCFPEVFEFVFSKGSIDALNGLSQIGICIFMFSVGAHIDVDSLRRSANQAVIVSHASILFCFLLGVMAAPVVFPLLNRPDIVFVPFALFLGIAMSITAFPVLVRILRERGLADTRIGLIATSCAAIEDVTAWTILAFVIALAKAAGFFGTTINFVILVLLVITMTSQVRPRLAAWVQRSKVINDISSSVLIGSMLILMLGLALVTELLGVHAIFGAFLAGLVIPRHSLIQDRIKLKLENISTVLLLPIFFCLTGLRTQIGLLNNGNAWMLCLGILFIAVVGKIGGTALAARFTGISWHDSLQLGILMNTRGLMELVVINIGYDIGVVPPELFTILVIMALVTTALTGPLLTVMERRRKRLCPNSCIVETVDAI